MWRGPRNKLATKRGDVSYTIAPLRQTQGKAKGRKNLRIGTIGMRASIALVTKLWEELRASFNWEGKVRNDAWREAM